MSEKRSPLVSAEAKIERAVEHLKLLEVSCQAFLESEPYDVPVDFDRDLGCHVLYLSIREGPPLRLAAILGDLVHNLRSALDHIAWQLAGREKPFTELAKPGVRKYIYFPITRSPDEFAKHPVMPYIADDARAILEGMQPYKRERPEFHPLAVLNTFWNTDKHRVLNAGFAGLDFSTVKFRPGAIYPEALDEVRIEPVPVDGPVKDGTPIAQVFFPADHAPETTTVDVNGKPTAEIFFGSGRLAVGLDTARNMTEYAGLALVAFRPLLDGS